MESVLLVGSSGVGKTQLIQALHGITQVTQNDSDLCKLQLDTKYYTADVLLRIVDELYQQSTHIEALILMFDATNRASLRNVQRWCDEHDVEDIEVKLVVGNKADLLQQTGTISRPEWLEEAITWSFGNGFEYIETAAAHPHIDTQLELDGDQQGVARVLAALQAHMWPGLVPKQRITSNSDHQRPKDQTVSSSGGVEAASVASFAADDSRAGSPEVQDSPTAGQEPLQPQQEQTSWGKHNSSQTPAAAVQDATTAAGSNFITSSSVAPSQQQQQQQQQPSKQKLSCNKQSPSVDDHDGLALPDPDDFDLDDFEKLMQQVQGVRARLSGLPDADRRAAAADMAMKLAAMMGLGDSDEDDDQHDGGTVEDQGIRQLQESLEKR